MSPGSGREIHELAARRCRDRLHRGRPPRRASAHRGRSAGRGRLDARACGAKGIAPVYGSYGRCSTTTAWTSSTLRHRTTCTSSRRSRRSLRESTSFARSRSRSPPTSRPSSWSSPTARASSTAPTSTSASTRWSRRRASVSGRARGGGLQRPRRRPARLAGTADWNWTPSGSRAVR
jgi:hypothetical protein